MGDINLIPESIRSDETAIFNDLLDRFDNIDLSPMLVYVIDLVDASALPFLASQFSIGVSEGWDLATTDAEKRALIKNAIPLHKLKGKRKGILYVLELLGLEGTYQNWDTYDGDPYHFRVDILVTNKSFSNDLNYKLITVINEFKRKSSILDDINLIFASKCQYALNSVALSGEVITIYPYLDYLVWNQDNWDTGKRWSAT